MKSVGPLLFLIWGLGMVYGLGKPLPPGVSTAGMNHRRGTVEFLYDLAWEPAGGGERIYEARIFSALLKEIARAENFIILDMFLFNDLGAGPDSPPLAAELTAALLAKKAAAPELPMVVISDEINTGYGSYPSLHLEQLRAAGIEVVLTDLTRLRDSNPLYSGLWRPLLQWLEPLAGRLPLTNIFDPGRPPMTLAAYLRLLNFKANHRKVLVTGRSVLIGSANPHDASGRHSNIALLATGPVVAEAAASELAVAAFSGRRLLLPPAAGPPAATGKGVSDHLVAPLSEGSAPAGRVEKPEEQGPLTIQLLTEAAIREGLVREIKASGPGDTIWLAMFYLTDRPVLRALAAAAQRGATVRLILDPNRDAFGHDKYGLPNRPIAARLKREAGVNLDIRWYETRGEQFHPKLLLIEGRQRAVLFGGSANLTRRNIGGYNLESGLLLTAPPDAPAIREAAAFCNRLWHNRDGLYTVDYQHYADPSPLKEALVIFQEITGLGSF